MHGLQQAKTEEGMPASQWWLSELAALKFMRWYYDKYPEDIQPLETLPSPSSNENGTAGA
jgi:hypothetical protein